MAIDVKKLEKFHNACQQIINHKSEKSLNYCINYAKYGLSIQNEGEMRIQIAYILNNMTHWRGEIAKQVRSDLKSLM